MRTTDVRAIGKLAGETLAAGGTFIRDMHQGIAGRPFEILGPAAAPTRIIHDRVSGAVYRGVQRGLRGAADGSARLATAYADPAGERLASRPIASLVLGALNGMWGDHLAGGENEFAFDMQIIERGAEVPTEAGAVRGAFSHASSRLVVFAHGLCETEAAWRIRPREGDPRPYGERLNAELGLTPVYVRYNTGLHISDSGRALSSLLEALVSAWPVPVEELVLVGHSMGGLVARSACHYGEQDDARWCELVRHVFCLGTPHLGADLEKGANVLAWTLRKLPETRPLANLINSRSVGIKDLRFGSCIEAEWCDCDIDEYLNDRCGEVPFLAGANYYFVASSLSSGPLGQLLGDLLVRVPSASGRGNGRGRCVKFEVENGHELTGLNHFQLLNHPAVYEQLRAWIERAGVSATAA